VGLERRRRGMAGEGDAVGRNNDGDVCIAGAGSTGGEFDELSGDIFLHESAAGVSLAAGFECYSAEFPGTVRVAAGGSEYCTGRLGGRKHDLHRERRSL
jgi:hypothetical protein